MLLGNMMLSGTLGIHLVRMIVDLLVNVVDHGSCIAVFIQHTSEQQIFSRQAMAKARAGALPEGGGRSGRCRRREAAASDLGGEGSGPLFAPHRDGARAR